MFRAVKRGLLALLTLGCCVTTGSLQAPLWVVFIAILVVLGIAALVLRTRTTRTETPNKHDSDAAVSADEVLARRHSDPAQSGGRARTEPLSDGYVCHVPMEGGGAAWLAFRPQPRRRVLGPFPDDQEARHVLSAGTDAEGSHIVRRDWRPPTMAIPRLDLSTPPYIVWEFTGPGPSLFGVRGPLGWIRAMFGSARPARACAQERAEEDRKLAAQNEVEQWVRVQWMAHGARRSFVMKCRSGTVLEEFASASVVDEHARHEEHLDGPERLACKQALSLVAEPAHDEPDNPELQVMQALLPGKDAYFFGINGRGQKTTRTFSNEFDAEYALRGGGTGLGRTGQD